MFSQLDNDSSGQIDYNEFVMAAIGRQQLLSKQRLEQTFKHFDIDGSGTISIKEIKEVFKTNKVNDSMWREMFSQVDDN